MDESKLRDALGLVRAYDTDVRRLLADGYDARGLFANLSPVRLETLVEFLQRQDFLRNLLVELIGDLARSLVNEYTSNGAPIDETNLNVQELVNVVDAFLRIGLRPKKSLFAKTKTYWDCVTEHFEATIKKPNFAITAVQNMTISPGAKGRGWILYSLMEKSLAAQLDSLAQNHALIKECYEPYAVLASEQVTVIAGLLASLESIDFNTFLNEQRLEADSVSGGLSLHPTAFEDYIQAQRKRLVGSAKTFSNGSTLVTKSIIGVPEDEVDIRGQIEKGSEGIATRNLAMSEEEISSPIGPLLDQKRYLEEELKSLQEKYEKASAAARENAELDRRNKNEISSLQVLCENSAQENERLKMHIAALTEQNTALNRERISLEKSHQKNSRESEVQTAEGVIEQAHELVQHHLQLEKDIQSLTAEANRLRMLNRSLLTDLSNSRSEAAQHQSDLVSLQTTHSATVAEVETSIKRVAALQHQIDDFNSRESHALLELDRTKRLLRSCKSESQHEFKIFRSQISLLRSSESSLRSSLDTSTSTLSATEARANEAERAGRELEVRVKSLEREIISREEVEMEISIELGKAKFQLEEAKKIRETLRQEKWVEDALSQNCTRCQSKFTMVNRYVSGDQLVTAFYGFEG